MSRSMLRIAAPVAVIGMAAGALLLAGPASADPVTSGTATITVPLATEFSQVSNGVFEIPLSPATASYDNTNHVVTESFPVTGGGARVSTFTGDLTLGGGLLIVNYKNHKSVSLGSLDFSLFNDQITAIPSGSSTAITLFDTVGNRDAEEDSPQNQTFTADDVQLDAAGASFLNAALGTKYFAAGQHEGAFSATWSSSVG